MCCLKNEEEAYEELNSKLPNVGDRVETADGFKGEVQTVSVLKQMVRVVITTENDEKEVKDYPVSELKFKPRRRRDRGNNEKEMAELRELEQLEKQDEKKSKLD